MTLKYNLAARVFALTALATICVGAQAQTFSENGLTYIIGGDSVVVKAQTKTEENVVIPDTVEYTVGETTTKYAVKGIAANGFFSVLQQPRHGKGGMANAAGNNNRHIRELQQELDCSGGHIRHLQNHRRLAIVSKHKRTDGCRNNKNRRRRLQDVHLGQTHQD